MKTFQVTMFREENGDRSLVQSIRVKACNALRAIACVLPPKAPVEGFVCTENYGEYRSAKGMLVRAVPAR